MATQTRKPDPDDLPAPVARSETRAQRTFAETRDSAYGTHPGDAGYASRVAYSSLKHSYEKVGDHWEAKEHAGPSDQEAEQTGDPATRTSYATHGGVDANASKTHLYELAQRLDVKGRSTMDKDELVEAIDKANQKANAAAR